MLCIASCIDGSVKVFMLISLAVNDIYMGLLNLTLYTQIYVSYDAPPCGVSFTTN